MQHGNDKTNEKMDNELENESPGENNPLNQGKSKKNALKSTQKILDFGT